MKTIKIELPKSLFIRMAVQSHPSIDGMLTAIINKEGKLPRLKLARDIVSGNSKYIYYYHFPHFDHFIKKDPSYSNQEYYTAILDKLNKWGKEIGVRFFWDY